MIPVGACMSTYGAVSGVSAYGLVNTIQIVFD